MAQSTGPGNPTSYTTPSFFQLPVANGQTIYNNRPVAVNTTNGNAYPMTAGANLRLVGFASMANSSVVGTASSTPNVNYVPPQQPDNRYWTFAYTGTVPVAGNGVYFVDDQTVATSAANSVKAGVVISINTSAQTVVVDCLPAITVFP